MKTAFVRAEDSPFDEAGKIIRSGGLVAFPTETVYGLGGNALDAEAGKKIFEAKGRPGDNPLIVHVAKPEDAELFAYTNETYYKLAAVFMPGPLTVVLPRRDVVPDSITGGLDTVAVRCPDHPVARELIRAAGVPVAAPSANLSGSPSPTTAEYVKADLDGRVDMIIDGGQSRIGVESTVITLADGVCTVLRPGDIIPRELHEVVGEVVVAEAVKVPSAAGDKPLSPGMKYKHYAPGIPLVLVDGEGSAFAEYINSSEKRSAALVYSEEADSINCEYVIDIGAKNSPKEQMHNIFKALRDVEEFDAEIIYAHLPPEGEEYLALYNRLIRASGGEVIKIN